MKINKKRYFLVSYQFHLDGKDGFGYSSHITKGGYINLKDFTNLKEKTLGKTASIVILNIMELNESDYNDFIKE